MGSAILLVMRTPILLLTITCVLCAGRTFGQTETGQTIANIPLENGILSVQNGPEGEVWLKVDELTINIDSEEALRVAGWIKEERTGKYTGSGSLELSREGDAFVVTLVQQEGQSKQVRMQKASAQQLAAALATGRQNVIEPTKS
jgi:hypothetical protein